MPDTATFRASEANHHHLVKNEEACNLGTRCDQRRARRRCSLIHIRCPEMKWHRGHLESKPNHHHHHGDDQQRIQRWTMETAGNALEIRRVR